MLKMSSVKIRKFDIECDWKKKKSSHHHVFRKNPSNNMSS